MQRTLLGLALLACIPAAFATSAPGDDIDRLVDQAMARYDLPGMAVGVIQDGRVVHIATRGQLAVDAPDTVDADTLFKIASNSKAMTAALLEWETIDSEQIDDIMAGKAPRPPKPSQSAPRPSAPNDSPGAEPSAPATA